MDKVWSEQQQAIFKWFEKDQSFFMGGSFPISADYIDTNGHLIIQARAGTGKSTTIRESVKFAPESNILIAAFSKDIQVEMESLIAPFKNGRVRTLHSIGLSCIQRFRTKIKIEFNSVRADGLAATVCGRACPDAITRLVSKLHTKGREIAPHARVVGDLTDIAIKFDCEPDEIWAKSGFPLDKVEELALAAMELASDLKNGDTIDGSDMIFLPVRNHWMIPEYEMAVVDEYQDMSAAQLELAQGVVKKGGRICLVGDNRQAIFAFRGADTESTDRLGRELKASELKLTTTYRCGRSIVEEAQCFVPDFRAGDNNPEGEVLELHTDYLIGGASAGDFILSRVNAPLVSIAMKLLRSGKRTRVAGRDIGKGLTTLINKFKARSVPDFLAKVESWCGKETQRYEKQLAAALEGRKPTIQAKIEAVIDQAEMLTSLAEDAKNVDQIVTRIMDLFSDSGDGDDSLIVCSSIHRAKGKEANRVFVLRDTLRDYNVEEENLQYVAITRAKNTLVWVSDSIQGDE